MVQQITSVVCSVVCYSAMLRPYHPLLLSTTMLFVVLVAKAHFLLAYSPILDRSLTGEMQLLKLVVTMNRVQSHDGGMKQQQIVSISQGVVTSQIVKLSLIPCKCWTLGVMNPQPPACKAGALPFKLSARSDQSILHLI